MPTVNGVVEVVFMANSRLQFEYWYADRLYLMFGVKAIPDQVMPGAAVRLMSWTPSYGCCVAGTIVFAQTKKLPWVPSVNDPAFSWDAVSVKTPKLPFCGVTLTVLVSHQTLSTDRFSGAVGSVVL